MRHIQTESLLRTLFRGDPYPLCPEAGDTRLGWGLVLSGGESIAAALDEAFPYLLPEVREQLVERAVKCAPHTCVRECALWPLSSVREDFPLLFIEEGEE
ncbi:MAG: hypothetical protein AB1330_01405 [Bacillota bacterium]